VLDCHGEFSSIAENVGEHSVSALVTKAFYGSFEVLVEGAGLFRDKNLEV
jgi:hypothetical protein